MPGGVPGVELRLIHFAFDPGRFATARTELWNHSLEIACCGEPQLPPLATDGPGPSDILGSMQTIESTTSATGLAASGPAAIEIRGLRKRYGDVVAVAGVDLEVHPGEIFGLLGPN